MVLKEYKEIIKAIDNKESFTMDLTSVNISLCRDIFKYLVTKLTKDSKIKKINRSTYEIKM